jgi:hypothetical protein
VDKLNVSNRDGFEKSRLIARVSQAERKRDTRRKILIGRQPALSPAGRWRHVDAAID